MGKERFPCLDVGLSFYSVPSFLMVKCHFSHPDSSSPLILCHTLRTITYDHRQEN